MITYGIFSDLHGADPEPIRDMFKARKIDKGICLGDFDRTSVARKVIDIQKEYELYAVPGNHDHSHVNKVGIRSGTMSRQGIDSPMMWGEWKRDPIVRKYVEDLLKSPTIELEIGGNKTLAIHGGLDGDYQTEPAYLWNRIADAQPRKWTEKEIENLRKSDSIIWPKIFSQSEIIDLCPEQVIMIAENQDYIKNFNAMTDCDIRIMLRGHDHRPQYARLDPHPDSMSNPNMNPKKGFYKYDAEGHGFNMFNERMHIVNPGAFYNGNYATITTDVKEHPILEFKHL